MLKGWAGFRCALALAAACLSLCAFATPALAQTGAISGTVTDASSGSPLENVDVTIYDSSDGVVTDAFTDASGNYTVDTLAPGSYKVGFSASSGNYLDQFYNGKSSLAAADLVAVADGSTTSGVDAALQAGGQITGTVTDASTHSGLADVDVTVYDSSDNVVTDVFTDSSGNYTVSGLPTGSYKVGFAASTGNYAQQFYNGKALLSAADAVTVSAGSTTPNIDAALHTGGQITGTVTDASSHGPLENVDVSVYDSSDNVVTDVFTDATGAYTVPGLPAGSYRVGFSATTGNYLDQFYNGKATLASADAVAVTSGSTASGIDAALQAGGQITGTVTDATTHGGLQNVDVTIYDSTDNAVTDVTTDATGNYTVTGLATGTYRVGFTPPDASHASLFYNGKPSLAAADQVSVTAGSTTGNINAALSSGGEVTGTVTDASSHAPVTTEDVTIYDAGGNPVTDVQTDPSGNYTATGLAPGNYKVGFQDTSGVYADQYYNDKPTLDTADLVTVSAGATTPAINAAVAVPHDLSVELSGAGDGSVSSSPAGIDCGDSCDATFDGGTKVTLTAVAGSGSTFAGWSGGGCSGTGTCVVTMSKDQAVTATFTKRALPACKLTSGGAAVALTKSKKKGVVPGTLRLTVTCTQAVSATLAGKLTMQAKKSAHGKAKATIVALPVLRTSLKSRIATDMLVKLPGAALSRLKQGAKELVTLTLSATNANGTASATLKVGPLKKA